MRRANPKHPENKRHVVECDCAGTCTLLVIQTWGDEDEEFYADLYTVPHQWTWRYRFRAAWNALTGKETNSADLVLGAPQATDLRDWLTATLDAKRVSKYRI